MLKIGDFSKLSRVSIRMLRHYDDMGLLTPMSIDKFTSYRYYSEAQLAVIGRITALKDMGFSLSVIKEILANYDDSESLEKYLTLKHTELKEQAEETAYRLRLLESAMHRLRKDDVYMTFNVTLKEMPARYVASVRKIIAGYEKEGMLWDILMRETAPLDIQDGDPCYAMALFHDAEFKEYDVDVEVQKSVKGQYADTENVIFKTEPPVLIASTIFKGSYDMMGDVNTAVANWIRDNGYEFNGPMFNIYYVSPHETLNSDDFVTEVCYPVKKA